MKINWKRVARISAGVAVASVATAVVGTVVKKVANVEEGSKADKAINFASDAIVTTVGLFII